MTGNDSLDALFSDAPKTMAVGDVASLLGVTKQSVYVWLRDGVIPGYKVGNTWFVLSEDLKKTMRAGRNGPSPKQE
ncbi:DNA binding domain, excisionase family [Mycobacteroides abscessus subsp. abscessus]|uniref:helix-turn-helix domain-containing protein n=1 Tax=Dermabacter TaxID=36739 RepID=UPI00092A5F3E|nr:helix-turn-helix domain-containing protein [Dermabacter vaginalis]MCG7444429.1 helix-turn-helix domain-containing protein [Dermabacter vaginalis]MCT1710158.1 helix-turn-helix domain-containing protein [Dermabacter hominis]SHY49168.1 DNA binding domain, excisionase family [Mycobacteroides abscessus subsp. abscessus]